MRDIFARLRSLRIRTRLLASYIGMMLIGLTVMTLLAGGQISTAIRADYERHLQDEVRLAAQNISTAIGTQDIRQLNSDQLAEFVHNQANQGTEGTLTLFAVESSGRGIPDQHFDTMPELESARSSVVIVVERPNAHGDATFYTAAAVIVRGQAQPGLLQLAVPASDLTSTLVQRWAMLALGFAIVTALASVAALVLSRSLIHPLYRLRDSAVRLSQGDLAHRVTITGRDEIADVGRAFNEMATQVQGMLDEQKAFASNTAHELRTPLTAIRLRTEALRHDATLDELTTQQYVIDIDDEVVHLSNLVQDLTVLTLFDAGRAERGHDEIDIVRLATTLVQQVHTVTQAKQLQLHLAAPAIAIQQVASLSHLTVVFRNLLDNAIKYTPTGGTITWTIQADEHGVTHMLQDSGQGIATAHLSHVFERFYRADAARSRDVPGTGLGLTLVKSIIDAYQGTITITSTGVGQGTTVRVYWPL